jgi:hypothetical protein
MVRATFRSLAVAAMFTLAGSTFSIAEEVHHPPPGAPHPAARPVPHGPPPGVPHGPPARAVVGPHPGPGPGPHGAFIAEPRFGPGQFSFRGRMIGRLHLNPFIYPPGWGYQRWAVGGILPPVFLAPAYYYADWAALGLPPPQEGYQWVRYGPDLLLVDVATGQVVDVAYGVFY